MHRTSFMLSPQLKKRAEAAAKKLNVSFGEFIRQAISEKAEKQGEAPDFFDLEWGVYDGPVPRDGSVRPEKYRFAPAKRRRR